jgi:hypothetical protein
MTFAAKGPPLAEGGECFFSSQPQGMRSRNLLFQWNAWNPLRRRRFTIEYKQV